VDAEQVGTAPGVLEGFHRSELGIVFIQDHWRNIKFLKQGHKIPARLAYEPVREEIAVAEDNAKCCTCHKTSCIEYLFWYEELF
jgi:hypothetical protein